MGAKKELILSQETNKDIIVSWIYAWSKQQNMSIHEQRVMIRVLEFCQKSIQGIKIKDNLRQLTITDSIAEITMPISDVFFSGMKNEEIEKTLVSLSQRTFKYRGEKNGEIHWWACSFIESPEVAFVAGLMRFHIGKRLWEVFVNFTSGFRKFELNKALSLPTTYAVRLYILMSGQERPCEMTISSFKEWLGIPEEQYKDKSGKDRVDNIEMRILKPAKEALDRICPYSFEYSKIRENPKSQRSRVTGFMFIPVYHPENRDPALEAKTEQAKTTARYQLDGHVYDMLRYTCEFTSKEINSNKETFILAQEHLTDVLSTISELHGKSREKKNPKGWFINALKGRTMETIKKDSTL